MGLFLSVDCLLDEELGAGLQELVKRWHVSKRMPSISVADFLYVLYRRTSGALMKIKSKRALVHRCMSGQLWPCRVKSLSNTPKVPRPTSQASGIDCLET